MDSGRTLTKDHDMRWHCKMAVSLPLIIVGCGPTSGGMVNPNPAMTNPSSEKPAMRTDQPAFVPETTPAQNEAASKPGSEAVPE